MARHATVLNLVPQSDTDEGLLRKALDVDGITFVKGSDIRDRGALGGLRHLRRIHRDACSNIFAIHTLNWSRQSQRTSLYGLACLIPARKRFAIDTGGKTTPLGWSGFILREVRRAVIERFGAAWAISRADEIERTYLKNTMRLIPFPRKEGLRRILYMRTDLWFGVKAGGSIGHVAGVIDGFRKHGIDVHVLSWDRPRLVPDDVEVTAVELVSTFVNDRELMLLAYNDRLLAEAGRLAESNVFDAVYARYALNCWAPWAIAEKLNVPLILEYNGSEVWIEKHWGRGLRYPKTARKIEDIMLGGANWITVVSRALADELKRRGTGPRHILVNPNGVDPDRFDPRRFPQAETEHLKVSLGIPADSIVAGFIGTFSPWHGVEILSKAIPPALEKCPKLHFLLIGAGPLLDKVKEDLGTAGVLDRVTLTGLVPQEEAPKHLMCCDFLLSPHVPNPDGTPFFGSPTKLFEYMALGKGIIASDLDQIGEILTHEDTALLTPPGDSQALSDAIQRLCGDRELSNRLGAAARKLALREYTWEAHAGRILDHLYSNV